MRFLTVFVNILCTAVVTVLGSDEKRDVTDEDWALIDPIDYGGTNDQIDYTGTIEASKLDCDQAGLTYGCCDGPDYFDSWIVAGCDIFSESNLKCFDYKKIYCCKSIGVFGIGWQCGRFFK